jgi:ubiquinone/menaquinone biosynthesis C-methylase UbiE
MIDELTTNNDVCYIDRINFNLPELPSGQWILDIGGGGEGMVGRQKGASVVAIDLLISELEEAPRGPLKIVMDAAELKFLDGTFSTATMFFSLMFMPIKKHQQVISEVFRVLAPGGTLHVWDGKFPPRGRNAARYVGIQMSVNVAGEVISTGYGRNWPDEPLTLEYYDRLASVCGFVTKTISEDDCWFYTQWEKPKP